MSLSRVLTSFLIAASTSVTASAAPGVAAGTTHAVVVTDQGTVWTWGINGYGQLGDGTTTARTVPVQVAISNVVAVAAGTSTTYALTDGGAVWAWGANSYGQIGDGTTQSSSVPRPVSTLSNVVAIAAGDTHALALRSDGSVWAWGSNGYGELGNGGTTNANAPIQISALGNTAIAIAARGNHSLAVTTDGSVLGWGSNQYGEVGDGTTTRRLVPTPAGTISGMAGVGAGTSHSFAWSASGALWAWGANESGQLGDGTRTGRTLPVAIPTLSNVVVVASGSPHSIALKDDGSVWTWGSNTKGQLGDGTTTSRYTPGQVQGISAVSVTAGVFFSVAISGDGRVWTWGDNYFGTLGNGTTVNSSTPIQIADAGFAWRVATPAFSVASGTYSWTFNVTVTCATPGTAIHYTVSGADPTETDPVIASGATLNISQSTTLKARAWKVGSNPSDIGTATYTLVAAAPSFSPVGGTYTTARNVTISTSTSGAEIRYTLDGSAPTASSPLYAGPFAVSTLTTVRAIALRTGWSTSAVASATYTFNYGTLSPPTFSPPAGEYAYQSTVTLAAQAGTTIRYTADGSVVTANSPVYVSPIVLTGTRTISAKAFHPDWTASTTATTIYTVRVATPRFTPDAGTYSAGQTITVDDDTPEATIRYTTNGVDPTEADPLIPAGTSFTACSCTVKARAFRAGWTPSEVKTAVYQTAGTLVAARTSAGRHHSAVLKDDGTLWTWGYNSDGQLGDGTVTQRTTPAIVNALTGIRDVSVGAYHTLAVTSDGRVLAWGDNVYGQLGDATTTDRRTPVALGLTDVVSVRAGLYFSLALKNDGTVWAWGANGSGQLGDGTAAAKTSPVQVTGLTGIVQIAAGDTHGLARRNDGVVFGWGENISGQVGDGTSARRTTPVAVALALPATEIATGGSHSLAVLNDATLWAWGAGYSGRLGVGYDVGYSLTPIQTAFTTAAQQVAGGSAHTLAVATDGSLWSWGNDSNGQLGDGNSGSYRVGPYAIDQPSDVAWVAAGMSHSIAVTEDGEVWVWGLNANGQLGDGTLTSRFTPVKIAEAGFAWKTATPVVTPSAGHYTAPVSVTITAATSGTVIHYTTDGSDPTPADPSVPSGGTVLIDATATLKAMAAKSGMPLSNVATATYTMDLPPVTGSPAAGTSSDTLSVVLSNAVSGATIRYTVDGTDPDESSPVYTTAIAIVASTVLKARASKPGWTDSAIAALSYTLKVATPAFTPGVGSYSAGQSVTVSTTSPGATLHYTQDGTMPSESSPVYVDPIPLTVTTTVKVRGFKAGWTASDVGATSYWINQGELTTPTLSPETGSYAEPVMVTIVGPAGASVRYTLDGTDPTARSAAYRWPIVLTSTTTLRARAFRSDWTPSAVASATYVLDAADSVATPVIGPAGGRFTTFQDVTLSCVTADATLRYTTDGTDPTESSDAVPPSGIVRVHRSVSLKVRAFKDGRLPSAIRRADFVITGEIAAGERASYALKADGTLWAWGENSYGQLGIGSSTPQPAPVQVSTISDVVAVSGGAYHALALTRDGSVWTWGQNSYGQLGLGDTQHRLVPTRVTAVANIVAVSAGNQHSLALTAEGSVWAWGSNGSGQLGDGTTERRTSPVPVPGVPGMSAVAAGYATSYALQGEGTDAGIVWAWGANAEGEVGDGTGLGRLTAVRVDLPATARSVAAGLRFALAILQDGSVAGWGRNDSGEPGDGTLETRFAPVHTAILTGTRAVSAGFSHGIALTERGQTWTWGSNYWHQLGDSGPDRAYPARIAIPPALLVAAGASHSVVGLFDGSLMTWGMGGPQVPTPVSSFTLSDNTWLMGDPDADGFPTWREYEVGTDPLDADTNDDGLADASAADAGLEGGNPDADADGVSNAAEAVLGTDPYVADTDGDGVSDRFDRFPLDPARSDLPPGQPGDTTPPAVTLIEPLTARPIPPQ